MPGWSHTGIAIAYPNNINVNFPAMKANPSFGILPLTSDQLGGNYWVFGLKRLSNWLNDTNSIAPSLTPIQAFQIDSKMDDGVPSSGSVRAFKAANVWNPPIAADSWLLNDNVPATGCVTDVAGASYNSTNNNVVCKIAVKWQ